MKRKTALILFTLSMSVMDCTGSRSSSETSSSAKTSASTKSAGIMAKASDTTTSLDTKFARTLAEMMTTDRQALMSFQTGGCVKTDYSLKSDEQDDQIFHVDCKTVDGTIEVIASKGGENKSYDITTDLTYSVDAISSRVDTSFYSIKIDKDKTERITKDFSETFVAKNASFEFSGTSNYLFTPDKDSESDTTGKISIDSTIYFSKNQKDMKYFDVASFGLHKSACGIDSGTLSFSNADVTYHITYSGCGTFNIKETKATDTAAFY